MRTMTTINWQRTETRSHQGGHFATCHSGQRGGWSFRIVTPVGGAPRLMAEHSDGRKLAHEHRSLRAAKDAALALMHPAEAMSWNAGDGQPLLYRAQWDSLVFAVYAFEVTQELTFQWRDTESGARSLPEPVSGVREARQLAADVLRRHYPTETPADAPQAVEGVSLAALASALNFAGIAFTDEQLATAAGAMLHGL